MIHMLLINANPVVSRLVEMSVQDEEIRLDQVRKASEIDLEKKYGLILVDDQSYNDKVAEAIARVRTGEVVFFSGRDSGEEIGEEADIVIKKPFLPSQVDAVVRECLRRHREEKSEPSETVDEPVLDEKEVARIKALLEETETPSDVSYEDEAAIQSRKTTLITQELEKEGIEIVPEEKIVEVIENEHDSRYDTKKEKLRRDLEASFYKALKKVKPKKLRKLLKGAEVTITIRFGDE